VKVWIYKGEALGSRAEREAAAAAARLSGQRARPDRPKRARGEETAAETVEAPAETSVAAPAEAPAETPAEAPATQGQEG